MRGVVIAVFLAVAAGNLKRWQSGIIFQAGPDITIKAKVDSIFKQISYGYEGTVVVQAINGQSVPYPARPVIRLYSPVQVFPGDNAEFSVSLKPIFGRLNEQGFDAERYAMSQGLVARASVKRNSRFIIESPFNWRHFLYGQITRQLDGMPYKGILLALTFGERSDIDAGQWQQLRTSGLAHLVAISGLHVGIAFGLGWGIGKIIMRGHYLLIWSPLVIACALAVGYAWLAGYTIPTLRAVMMCLIYGGLLFARIYMAPMQKILITLCLVLLLDPFSSLSLSFWMSFIAISAVFLQLSKQRFRTLSGVKQLVIMQFSITVLLAPFSVLFFSGFSVDTLIFNLIFIPWFTVFVVPAALLSLVFSALQLPGVPILWTVCSWLLIPVDRLTSYAGHLWFSVSGRQMAVLFLAAGLYLLWPVFTMRARYWCGIFVAAIGLSESSVNPAHWRIDVLDVGHGLAVLIEKNGRAVLYDTGAGWDGGDIATMVISPLLSARGYHTLDGVIISHMDNDHAGGLAAILQDWSPEWFRASQSGLEALPCVKGEHWQWQGLTFSVLWPPQMSQRAYNPHSCVIRITDAELGHSVLLTGDVDAVSEWLLIRESDTLQSEVMIVPHHGSRTSSSSGVIDRVRPKIAIASTAKGHRWKLPA